MGRPRSRHKDLPHGLYKDPAGRFYLKAFTDDDRARLGGRSSQPAGKDPKAARELWAKVFGFREHDPPEAGTIAELVERFLDEDLVRIIKRKGRADRPKYAPRTQQEYRRIAGHMLKLYGARKYARSEAEAGRGGFFRTMDVSAHLRSAEEAGKPVQGNHDAAFLGSVFRYAKECGLTEYNPCLGASRNTTEPREQDLDDALFLEIYEEADAVLRCLMDLDVMIGSRVSDLLSITEFDWKPEGLMAYPSKRKRGQAKAKQLFERTPDLEEVIERSIFLRDRILVRDRGKPGYKPIKTQLLFVGPEGERLTMSGFQSKMRRTKARVARKRLAAAGVQAPTPEQLAEAVRGIDIHFHDGRARAIADATEAGQHPARFAGHTDDGATARRNYLNRRVTKLRPNPRIKVSEPGGGH